MVPGAAIIPIPACPYGAIGNVPVIEARFLAIKATVIIIILQALLKVARKALKGPISGVRASAALLAIFAFQGPFPLILVTQFVGFMAGAQAGGWGMGVLAAIVTLWVTFTPCFLWIFAGAPYVEWIATRPRLTGALQGITAAVVGVIANLSIWFALNVWFAAVERNSIGLWVPDPSTINLTAIAVSALAGALLLWRKMDLLPVLALMGAVGIAASYVSPGI